MALTDPPFAADEREMLIAFNDYQREVMVIKLEGLSEEQARSVTSPKGNSLAAMVRHLLYVERHWFRAIFRGEQELEFPWTDEDPDADFRVPEELTMAALVDLYRSEWAISNQITREADTLDRPATVPTKRGNIPTLRWILNHMLEETARHAGHADIAREFIDGSTGDG